MQMALNLKNVLVQVDLRLYAAKEFLTTKITKCMGISCLKGLLQIYSFMSKFWSYCVQTQQGPNM